MTRVKKGLNAIKKRRSILKRTKGYRFDRSRKKRAGREAIFHSAVHSFDHRRDKKGDFRRLWNIRINATVKEHGLSYSTFINALKKNNISINRKMLSKIAEESPEAMTFLINKVRQESSRV